MEPLERVFARERGYIERSFRKLGVPERDIDDATQQVFIVLARKLVGVRPGSERAFLYQTALNVAAHARRSLVRKRETLGEIPELVVEEAGADELVDGRRCRALLDRVLAKMNAEQRLVFELHEIECMTRIAIATTLELPPGTVASRLRRARRVFERESRRLNLVHTGGAACQVRG